jgi:pseudouridine kinase
VPSIVCLGGASVDRKYQLFSAAREATSNPARVTRSFGGVARNVAENLARMGVDVALLSRVGEDEGGSALLRDAALAGIDIAPVLCDRDAVTSEYAAILDPRGDLVIAAADANAVEQIPIQYLQRQWTRVREAQWIFLDCNISAAAIAWCIAQARETAVKVAVDAVSDAKAARLPADLSGIELLLLNRSEAAAYLGERAEPQAMAQALLARSAARVILTLGPEGLVAADSGGVQRIAAVPANCVDATGAGDALVAAVLYGLAGGKTLAEAARTGVLAAGLTVESSQSVRRDLSVSLLAANHHRLEH